jgi:hypothetical protein
MIMAIFHGFFQAAPGFPRKSVCEAILLDHNELDEAQAMYQARWWCPRNL